MHQPIELPQRRRRSSQETTDRVCVYDVLLLVGDFNTRVGSSERQDISRWEGVRGYHGVGRRNESGVIIPCIERTYHYEHMV